MAEMEQRAADDAAERDRAEPPRRQMPFLLSLVLNLVLAIAVVAVVQAFLVKVYSVPSGSMESTLEVGDRILVNRLASPEGPDAVQDVVVFNAAGDWQEELPPTGSDGPLEAAVKGFGDLTGIGPSNERALVKRVIAQGGQEVACCSPDGAVTVDGEPLDEPYVDERRNLPFEPGRLDCESDQRSLRCFGPIDVPEGSLLVMGDNRGNSADSVYACRGLAEEQMGDCARFVAHEDVVGKVFATMWPPQHWRWH